MCRLPSTSVFRQRLIHAALVVTLAAALTGAIPSVLAQDSSAVVLDAPSSQVISDTTGAVRIDSEIRLLRSMVEANPERSGYRIRLARALFDARRYDEAVVHFDAYLSGVQGSPRIIRDYLFALAQTEGGLEEGERVAARYARLYPTDAEIHMRLGYFRLWRGRYGSARAACEQALRLDPEREQAAACAEQAANPPAAAGGFTRVDRLAREVRSDPEDTDARFRLVEALADANRFQEAWDHLLVLESAYGHSARWLDAFLRVEAGLARPDGSSPMYAIDRATYLLRVRPGDRELRLRLVDLLVEESRFEEALAVLTEAGRMDVRDAMMVDRIRRIENLREAHADRRVARLTDEQRHRPLTADELTELVSHFVTLGHGSKAVETCDLPLASYDESPEAGVFCMRTLAGLGYTDPALDAAGRLERTGPVDASVRRAILITRLEAGRLEQASLSDLDTATDPDVLLAAAGYFVRQGQTDRAESLLDRLPHTPASTPVFRREAIEKLVERERSRAGIEQTNERLRSARRLAAAGNHVAAVAEYERYFDERGARTRPELRELADVHAAAGEYEQALSILVALEERLRDTDLTKQIARIRMDTGDAGGALVALDRVIAERPRDWEARLWRADILADLGYHEEALAVYDDVPDAVGETYAVAARRAVVENNMRGGGTVGDWSGLDYAGILAPSAEGVRARGGETTYDRWGQGMQTHVTTPVGLVVLAGIDSHFLSGTRRLVPDSEIVRGRINRIWTGGIFDFTPQIPSDRASYTSRLSFQGGLFDYEGGRTMPFASIRYWRQEPGVYDGSVGVHSTEGSLDLWSPAGGQYDLRITQFNAKGTTTALAADSTIRVAGNVSINLVTDNLGSTLEGERNIGSNIRLEAGYRVATDTYLGIEYQGIDYRSTVDIYWSPQNYSQYDVFLEYEGESRLQWYLRLRAAVGMVARSNGFVTRRLEADYIRRLDDNFSISIRTGLSASARSTGSAGSSVLDRYNSVSFGAALYWTL